MSQVITRFAPSPTGRLHLGNVRTALLNWLYARKHGGSFLLRFEDTDRERSEAQYIAAIQEDMQWLGLSWDGEVLFQSQHADKHQQALEMLAGQGHAFRCFCSEHQINLDRKLAAARGLPPRYSGRCRVLTTEESEQRAASEPFVWRLAVHAEDDVQIAVRDLLRGDVHFGLQDLDDPVVVRSDGTFTFLLPNAVDDALDGITHVLRGDDHLTNSAYQVWMLERLGHSAPVYIHHGLLLSREGAKLSKRTGSHTVAELRQADLFPEAIVQAMTRLGHPNISDEEVNLDALAEVFEAEKLSTSAVRWLDETMWRWHTRLLHDKPVQELLPQAQRYLPSLPEARAAELITLLQGNLDRLEHVSEYLRLVDPTVLDSPEAYEVIQEAGEGFFAKALKLWHESAVCDWAAWAQAVKEATGCKGKMLFMPLRAALTGNLHGPEMSGVIGFLGREGVTRRLEDVLGRIE